MKSTRISPNRPGSRPGCFTNRSRPCHAGTASRACEISTGPSTAPSSWRFSRSEEHTSELQSRGHLVCRLLLEKKINSAWERRNFHLNEKWLLARKDFY